MNKQKATINLGLLGLGTVGSGTLELIRRNGADITRKTGVKIHTTGALVRTLDKQRPISADNDLKLTTNADDILNDPNIDIIVELIGGINPAKEYITRALQNGKHVVTANKDLLAQHGYELFNIAKENNRSIYYEASVGGGIPLIRPLKNCLAANKIENLMGIINGTTNYILTQMTKYEKEFAVALKEAQEAGFAEADPSSDLEGRDAAYKLSILASLAFNSRVDINDVHTESIKGISVRDIMYAKQLNFVIKLLAIGEETENGLALRVHPTLVPNNHPLASVQNEFNALFLTGDAVGEVMFYGKGAGSFPTASAVVADIMEAVRKISGQVQNGNIETTFDTKPIISMEEQTSRFYLRLKANDQSGVFGRVATALGDENVSLDMILQNQRSDGRAEIVLITHDTKEENFYRALDKIKILDGISTINNVIRVLERGN